MDEVLNGRNPAGDARLLAALEGHNMTPAHTILSALARIAREQTEGAALLMTQAVSDDVTMGDPAGRLSARLRAWCLDVTEAAIRAGVEPDDAPTALWEATDVLDGEARAVYVVAAQTPAEVEDALRSAGHHASGHWQIKGISLVNGVGAVCADRITGDHPYARTWWTNKRDPRQRLAVVGPATDDPNGPLRGWLCTLGEHDGYLNHPEFGSVPIEDLGRGTDPFIAPHPQGRQPTGILDPNDNDDWVLSV